MFGKADSEQHSVGWGCVSFNAAQELCIYCPANRSDKPYVDAQASAKWRLFRFSLKQFLARMKHPLHPLFAAGFFTRQFLRIDCMHDIDCDGVGNIVIGAVLSSLVRFEPRLGMSQQDRMDALNASNDKYYSDKKVKYRMPAIRLSNLWLGEAGNTFACFHGPLVKASNCRLLRPWLDILCRDYFETSSQRDRSISKLCASLNVVVSTMYSADLFLTAAEQTTIRMAMLKFGKYFQWLAEHSQNVDGILMWPFRPKVHWLMHLDTQCILINPRFVQCYIEEGLCGKIAIIARSCMNGPSWPASMQFNVLIKVLLGVQLRKDCVDANS